MNAWAAGENEGVVEVRYEKNHAYYRYRVRESAEALIQRGLVWFENLPDNPIGQPH